MIGYKNKHESLTCNRCVFLRGWCCNDVIEGWAHRGSSSVSQTPGWSPLRWWERSAAAVFLQPLINQIITLGFLREEKSFPINQHSLTHFQNVQMTNLRGLHSYFLISVQMQYVLTPDTGSCSLCAVRDHFVINILCRTSINLELSANGRQTLPGDCVRGSSVKSSVRCSAVTDSMFKSCFWGSHPTLLLQKKPNVTHFIDVCGM